MRPISPNAQSERDVLIEEYRRLVILAAGALDEISIRGRPNWGLFFEAQHKIVETVDRIKEINEGQ